MKISKLAKKKKNVNNRKPLLLSKQRNIHQRKLTGRILLNKQLNKQVIISCII